MILLILALLVSLALAGIVVGMVAIPAQRQGRDMLTPTGERVVTTVRSSAAQARQAGVQVAQTAREKAPRVRAGSRD